MLQACMPIEYGAFGGGRRDFATEAHQTFGIYPNRHRVLKANALENFAITKISRYAVMPLREITHNEPETHIWSATYVTSTSGVPMIDKEDFYHGGALVRLLA